MNGGVGELGIGTEECGRTLWSSFSQTARQDEQAREKEKLTDIMSPSRM